MSGYPIKLQDRSFESMIYAARSRMQHIQISDHPSHAIYVAEYELIEDRINRAYPIIGVETVRFPHTHLNALLDVMILAIHSMPNMTGDRFVTTCAHKRALMKQKRALIKHQASDVVTRMAALSK